ncbi:DUF5067 domain-containing protein [Bifidobacterium sp. 64T4]|uniref:DUF5067 domain-containing protein n=1 Tax=Bifidobacterium pongonis TaxID=2834432 RepID=UPI001C5989B3|nr:DUF5067 domain-containing protein [Bifidobacterium pongonis]MBW3095225.1 DUF5067 domain-containing protein [Bifidobacterium pongonis]
MSEANVPQQPQPPMQPVGAQPPRQNQNFQEQRPPLTVTGVVGVVFGALGLVLSFIPIINNLAAILGLVGAVLGIIAIVGTFRGKKHGKALAIVAVVLSVLAIVITLAMQSAASKAIDDAMGVSTSQTSGDSSSKKDSTAKKTESKGEQDLEGDLKTMHVKIVSAVRSSNDYENNPTVLVTYEWTNNTKKNNSFASLADPKVFQNGSSLDTAIYTDAPAGYDASSYLAEVQPGATATVTIGYVLKDDSEITVDITDFMSMDDSTKVKHVFAL